VIKAIRDALQCGDSRGLVARAPKTSMPRFRPALWRAADASFFCRIKWLDGQTAIGVILRAV